MRLAESIPSNPLTETTNSRMIELDKKQRMTLLAINTEKSGAFYFMGEDEKRRVLFTSGFHQARRFATPEAAHRVRESARFFNAVREQFPGAESVSIEPEAAGIRKLFNL